MSSCCGAVCLLVLLGVVVTSGSPFQYISQNMKTTHERIADALKLKQPEVGSNPLFSSVIRSINTSCQRKEEVLLMNATLDVYMRIFSSILQRHHTQHHEKALLDQLPETNRDDVTSALEELKEKMDRLKTELNRKSHDKEDVIGKLNKIKVDDVNNQKKALAEFKEIYQAASVIGSRSCGHAHSS
ncbi:interferon gamma 1-like [Scomber scombrus]|uniref:Interferon gamma 1-like n=1 Tax=Scomber scombrus TaxID=13677 RepID=A0AAV1PSV8_SCOSC